MIELVNLTAQTLQPGQTLTFDKCPKLHTGCGECFNRQIPNSVKLCGKGVYKLEFSGNVTSTAAGNVQLAIAISGTPLSETAMNAQIAAAGNLTNVGTGTYFKNCCCDFDRVTVMNTGTTPVTVAPNANLRIARRS